MNKEDIGVLSLENFVSVEWLNKHLYDDDVIVLDCRFDLFDEKYGKKAYEEAHIKNAFYMDVNNDLSGAIKEHGGYRPIPDIYTFKEKLENIGINNHSIIIVYDENIYSSPRLWWLLKYIGHEKVYVLNGGIRKWIQSGYSVTKDIPKCDIKGKYNIKLNKSICCDMEYVRESIENKDVYLIDSRDYERYSGEYEPLYKKGGHIPSAQNYVWKNNLIDGLFKTKKELETSWKEIINYSEIICYCGSSIEACINYIALDEMNKKGKVYIGSFSDWISYDENLVNTI